MSELQMLWSSSIEEKVVRRTGSLHLMFPRVESVSLEAANRTWLYCDLDTLREYTPLAQPVHGYMKDIS